MTKLLGSGAYIISSTQVMIVGTRDSETNIVSLLRSYINTVGFSSKYPNFKGVNIGAVHPFILLMFADVMQQPQPQNVFPSVTVADTNFTETAETLANEFSYVNITAEVLAQLRSDPEVFVSDEGVAKLDAAIAANGQVVGVMREFRHQHSMAFNIWADNRDVMGFLFDLVDGFFETEVQALHLKDIDVVSKSGRKTGDVNMEYGRILYGSTISVDLTTTSRTIVANTEVVSIASIDATTLPQYFTLS